MLPNHSPLVIAEQFGTLEALHPGRIDLGLGRAPGTDQLTVRALRRDLTSAESFPRDVLELQHFLRDPVPGQAVVATPGAGTRVPLWILGSSLYGAESMRAPLDTSTIMATSISASRSARCSTRTAAPTGARAPASSPTRCRSGSGRRP